MIRQARMRTGNHSSVRQQRSRLSPEVGLLEVIRMEDPGHLQNGFGYCSVSSSRFVAALSFLLPPSVVDSPYQQFCRSNDVRGRVRIVPKDSLEFRRLVKGLED